MKQTITQTIVLAALILTSSLAAAKGDSLGAGINATFDRNQSNRASTKEAAVPTPAASAPKPATVKKPNREMRK